nr:unnamed protein product [Callosobruchus chinensis]CAH7752861.1 unnamed protein product [Callosobruchus chinensis]
MQSKEGQLDSSVTLP